MGKLIGQSPEFENIVRATQMVARTDVTILLSGESGTGKEVIANNIHQHSQRADKPFITINCAALPENLVESELFGHRKGSFTGADRNAPGRIRSAEGGTLFLDEIGELPLAIQAKLLRFLENGECQAVGENTAEKVNVRVIAATNRDLHEQVKNDQFREDLFYRLNIVPFELPPLRERKADITLFLKHFTKSLAEKHSLTEPRYSKASIKALSQHSWPGNVRELRNFCERMLVLLPGQEIEPENLPRELFNTRSTTASDTVFSLPDGGIKLEELEQQMISQALQKSAGNQSGAARLLGLSRDTFLYRVKKYAITH